MNIKRFNWTLIERAVTKYECISSILLFSLCIPLLGDIRIRECECAYSCLVFGRSSHTPAKWCRTRFIKNREYENKRIQGQWSAVYGTAASITQPAPHSVLQLLFVPWALGAIIYYGISFIWRQFATIWMAETDLSVWFGLSEMRCDNRWPIKSIHRPTMWWSVSIM